MASYVRCMIRDKNVYENFLNHYLVCALRRMLFTFKKKFISYRATSLLREHDFFVCYTFLNGCGIQLLQDYMEGGKPNLRLPDSAVDMLVSQAKPFLKRFRDQTRLTTIIVKV